MNTELDEIVINWPESKDDMYLFALKNKNNGSIQFTSNSVYNISVNENEQLLSIPSKEDLGDFSDLFSCLKDKFMKEHEQWFEEKFTDAMLDDLFKNYLKPNISENCIDLKIVVVENVLEELKKCSIDENICSIIPTFLFDRIELSIEDNIMNCIVVLDSFKSLEDVVKSSGNENNKPDVQEEEVNEEEEEVNEEEEKVNEEEEKVNEEEVQEEKVNEEKVQEEKVNEEKVQEEEVMQEIEPTINEEETLEELNFDTSNLDDSEIKLNVEDYLIIYNHILGQIKENKIREIETICNEKNINMEVVDYDEIFNNSDDEYLSSDENSEISDEETSLN
tara:strand:- start:138 stop:1142 length:1005 start_codon:yes stop_codon:yes gene_type:complete